MRSVEFLGGMEHAGGWRPESSLPEIALAGRSNVGKSSLINRLLGRRKMARVSKTPGRTREINFFRVNDAFVLADLPGYGYARVARERRDEWGPLIQEYLRGNSAVRGVVHLMDIRHAPADDDRRMLQFLSDTGMPTIGVLSKSDKLRRSEAATRRNEVASALRIPAEDLILFSAVTGEGRDELAMAMERFVQSSHR